MSRGRVVVARCSSVTRGRQSQKQSAVLGRVRIYLSFFFLRKQGTAYRGGVMGPVGYWLHAGHWALAARCGHAGHWALGGSLPGGSLPGGTAWAGSVPVPPQDACGEN